MICPICGTEYEQEIEACSMCGYEFFVATKQETEPEEPVDIPAEPEPDETENTSVTPEPENTSVTSEPEKPDNTPVTPKPYTPVKNDPVPKPKPSPVKLAIGIVAGCALLGFGGYTIAKSFIKKPLPLINLSAYVNVTFSGEDGSGIAEGNYDYMTMVQQYPEVFRLDNQKKEKIKRISEFSYSDAVNDSELLAFLFKDVFEAGPVRLELSSDHDLKNNDIVSVLWASGEETLEDIFAADFIWKAKSFTVSDLTEQEEPQETASIYTSVYVSVDFSGENGSGKAQGSFDFSSMISDYPEVFQLDDSMRNKIKRITNIDVNASFSDYELLEALFGEIFESGSVCMGISPNSQLKNNDTVVVSWIGGESALEDIFNADFICENKSFTVKNLTKKVVIPKEPEKPTTPTPTTPTATPTQTDYVSLPNGLSAPADNFLFPYSRDSRIAYSELDQRFGNMDDYDQKYYSQLVIDEIFFRYGWSGEGTGYGSNLMKMINQFNQYDWYNQAKNYYPGVDWYTFEVNYMSQVEKDNINTVNDWQKANIPEDL